MAIFRHMRNTLKRQHKGTRLYGERDKACILVDVNRIHMRVF
jgi:hypothetical protein